MLSFPEEKELLYIHKDNGGMGFSRLSNDSATAKNIQNMSSFPEEEKLLYIHKDNGGHGVR
jgi:hypothetical protein